MKKLLVFGLLFTLLGVTSCSLNDDEGECATGPVLIMLNLVEVGTNANVFSNGTYQQSNFNIVGENGATVNYNFLNVDGDPHVRIDLGQNVGDKIITLVLDSETTIDIEYTMAVSNGTCISYYVTDFDIPDYDFDQSSTTGIIRVYL